MAYTVKELSTLSGVSIRTLHFYDEIGLLKPAYYGENGYRYYEENELLLLQQILFYRELNVSLRDIEHILKSTDFDKLHALESHKDALEKRLNQTHELIQTVNKTIEYLRGKTNMSKEEMYYGFDSAKQQEYESYLLETGTATEKQIHESQKKIKNWKREDWDQYRQEGDELNRKLVDLMKLDRQPNSKEVHDLIDQHYQMIAKIWTPDRQSYIGLAQLYNEHPDFKQFYSQYHPDLARYLLDAIRVFSENKLK